ncbi:TonB-dependent receptor [Fulvivirga sp. M361]|uniref:TonB-dependent receptor n=1 Tax=Fulvivirga sp. M361 TaxID=2594266 RepID=UPI0016282398|nr:TonB-dependent receptor [Fulvivirga sp. M361]
MKSLIITLMFVSAALNCLAQDGSVKGVVTDQSNETLPGAHVKLLSPDSLADRTTITNMEGLFQFQDLKYGMYTLQISFIGFDELNMAVELSGEQKELDLGTLKIKEKEILLKELEVTGERIPVTVKEDTVEYDADAYKNNPNESLVGLLRKMPGIQLDEEGRLFVNGKEVKNVMIDGKTFFMNDPKTAIENLNSDIIDRIQMIDRKSEQSRFTGVENGDREMTLNLVLKPDVSRFFGNISTGYGTDDRFRSKGNFNVLNERSRISVIGSADNVNGLDIDNPSNRSISANGITTAGTMGVNINTDAIKGFELNSAYNYNRRRNEVLSNSERQNFLEGNLFDRLEEQDNEQKQDGHNLSVFLNQKPKDNRHFGVMLNINRSANTTDNQTSGSSIDTFDELISRNLNSNAGENDTWAGSGQLFYFKKLGKEGKNILTGSLRANYNDNESDLSLISENSFFREVDTTEFINQEQVQLNETLNLTGSLSYLYNFKKNQFISLTYSIRSDQDEVSRDFFDLQSDGGFLRNEELSTAYDRDFLANLTGLSYNRKLKNGFIQAGMNVQYATQKGTIEDQQTGINNSFLNLLPEARWNLQLSGSKNITLAYTTSVQIPTLEQLNPITDNSDPFLLRSGNPDLEAGYNHNLRFSYRSHDPDKGILFFNYTNISYARNGISQLTNVDSLLRQTTTPVNVDDQVNAGNNFAFEYPIKRVNAKIGANSSISYGRGILFVNEVENTTNRLNYTLGLILENKNKKIYDWAVNLKYNNSNTTYSENTDLDQQFSSFNYAARLGWNITSKWRVNSSFTLNEYSGAAFDGTTRIPVWTATFARSVLSSKGELQLSAFDLLNENQGVSRSSAINYLEERRFNTLSRYFMVSFRYNLGRNVKSE